MNKHALFLLLLFCSFATKAQIANPGFEQIDSTGKIGHWGQELTILVWIDSLGQSHQDSIVFDLALYFSTTDAHSGSRALEMRNAYNYTTNKGIAGAVHLTATPYTYSSFQSRVDIQQKPGTFSFYYKFLPAGADTAWALMTVYDSTGDEIGTAMALISKSAANYKQLNTPVVYTSSNPAAAVGINFITCQPGGNPTYGTRFLVDDVNVQALGIGEPAAASLQCYPTIAKGQLHVILPDGNAASGMTWRIIAANGKAAASGSWSAHTGKSIDINVAALPVGSYVLAIITQGQVGIATRFIKE